jgi:type IV pilus assembly protein PilM
MAAPPIVSLNLGSHSLGMAVFELEPGVGLVLKGYHLQELLSDPGAEADREQQLREVLPIMISELGIKPGRVRYAVSGQRVFARFVKLPAVEEEKIERIIAFEAQQNVPFPIAEVVWDYQLVGSKAGERMEVVLVAIKADLLERTNAAVEGAGLQTMLVDVAAMALYNAFRYNYCELQNCSLLIDIGARTTNLLFVEPGNVFSRSVPIGGSSITSAIAKEFNESYAAAELRKKQHQFLSLGDCQKDEKSRELARISQLERSTMMRLHAEVARSISFYRTQQKGSRPDRIFLCGGAASTPRVREFFHEKLHLPVEFLNPLRNLTVTHSVALEQISNSAHLLGELVGLALRGVATCPMELNFRPASVVRRERLAERQPFLILATICFLLGLLAWGLYLARLAHVQSEIAAKLQPQVSEMQRFEVQLRQLRQERDAMDAAASPLLDVVRDQGAWLGILDDLNARRPQEQIWITELAPTSDGKIVTENGPAETATEASSTAPPLSPAKLRSRPMIDGVFVRGLYLFNPRQQEVVVDYFRNLLGSAVFEVDPNRQSEVIKPSTPTATEWAYPYELRLKLRHPFPLQ